MSEIFFRLYLNRAAEDASLLTDVVKSIDISGKNFFRFTAIPKTTNVLEKFKNTLFEDVEIEMWVIDVTDRGNDKYAVGRLVSIEQVNDEYYSFGIMLEGNFVKRG